MAEPIIVPAALRPWLKSGLSALLLESPERVAELRARSAVPSVGISGKSRPPKATAPAIPPAPTTPVPTTPAPPSSHASLDSPRESGFHAARTVPPSASPEANATLLPPAILPLSEWPAPWLALKNRRPLPPRPLVFWTYAGLGDDLMGTADAARQQAIVRLLTALHHPGGTHVFWPCTLPDAQATSPSLFWSGVEWLKPRVILVFGSEARDALGLPKSLLPFGQERIHGRLIVQLHQPASLVDDEPLRRATAFLSRLLDFCAPR